jgi:(E)-4-hydroxy-3-methylbut-2-enyl-diphosphate synthase
MEAALWADKVRINPGNFADAKKFAVEDYSDREYHLELERIADKFRPLVDRCKERGVSIRIGTNHGSLSDRIMTRYGDTPVGMVESALEFVRMCETWGYRDLILSMKASNPKVMVAAYRLLAARMDELGMTHPFHLGVTEAGNGEDGRIKSAAGIGSLLEDGIGDTVRVSLTEDPEFEIPVAQELVRRYTDIGSAVAPIATGTLVDGRNPFEYTPRPTREVSLGPHVLGGGNPALVFVRLEGALSMTAALGLNRPIGRDALRPDALVLPVVSNPDRDAWHNVRLNSGLMSVRPALIASIPAEPIVEIDADAYHRMLHQDQDEDIAPIARRAAASGSALMLEMQATDLQSARLAKLHDFSVVGELLRYAQQAEALGVVQLILAMRIPDRAYRIRAYRLLDSLLREQNKNWILHLVIPPGGENLIDASISLGSLLCDGIGSSVSVEGQTPHPERLRLAFNILQASGARLTKTEFIACPSCGRTLFDLQSTTERIKERTGHLKGVKIAVMGCIVNGLGELADADFGYMGSGEGKVNLFVGKTCVEKNLPEAVADERLVALIKNHNRWIEPPESGA